MSDEGFDPCECMWSNAMAMQRLISILRQTQNYCTDNECFSLSRLPGSHPQTQSPDYFLTFLIIAFVVVMYALRPNSLRWSRKDEAKTRNNGSDPNSDPPTPPPLSN